MMVMSPKDSDELGESMGMGMGNKYYIHNLNLMVLQIVILRDYGS